MGLNHCVAIALINFSPTTNSDKSLPLLSTLSTVSFLEVNY